MKKVLIALALLLLGLNPLSAAPCGDVNSDGKIDIIDALMTAQYYVGLELTNFDQGAADVSGDGKINIVDALQMAQYYVGLINKFVGCVNTPTPTPTAPPTIKPETVFAVNCGGSAYTASDGTVYAADTGYSGGNAYSGSTSVSGTSDPTLYSTERYGSCTYAAAVSNGYYLVTLHFAETYHSAAGARSFNILMEGTEEINGLDIYAEAGSNTAYTTQTYVTVSDGEINIEFVTIVENAKINAIKVALAGPAAVFSYSPAMPIFGRTISFDASASNDSNGTIVAYSWDFGDSTTDTGVMISHMYQAAGDYYVTLTVTDNDGYTGSVIQKVTVHTGKPVVDFTMDPQVARPNETVVTVNASASYDPDGSIVSYHVNYGDGATGSGVVTTHIYTSVGDYMITVTVTDNDGKTASLSKQITVSDKQKYRLIWSSDIPKFPVTNSDPDDVQTYVRLLLYSNELDIVGLIASAATYSFRADKQNIHAILDKYDLVRPNLIKHDPGYPTTDYLRSVAWQGMGNEGPISISWGCGSNWSSIIGAGRDSEASEGIIAEADKPDPRPLWIGVAGGPREVAQAIWKVQNTRSAAEAAAFISKLRVFLIYCQDDTHGWLMNNVPGLFIVESKSSFGGFFCNSGNTSLCDKAWLNANIYGHGALCDIYPDHGSVTGGVQEGDTPAFLHLISADPSRLGNDPEDQSQPSWGGQYQHVSGTNHWVDGPGGGTINMWRADYQAEFAERADWCLP